MVDKSASSIVYSCIMISSPTRTALLLSVTIFLTSPANSQTIERQKTGVLLGVKEMDVRVSVCDDMILHITVRPKGTNPARPSLTIDRKWHTVPWTFTRSDSTCVVRARNISAKIHPSSGAIEFFGSDGNLLTREDPQYPHALSAARVAGEQVFTIAQRFLPSPDEGMYGLGQFEYGIMNLRGHHITLIQNNRHVVVPFLLSSRNYGILWDNYSHTEFDDGPSGMTLWSEVADGIDYYIIAGSSADDVIAGLRNATGHAPMWPRWAFGYWQSKERYENEDDLMSAAREYRRRRIPIDNIVQDWQYWGKLGWNAMDFDRELYPDPKGMIDSLHQMYRMHLMLSVWPQVDSTTAVYRELRDKGHLYPTEIWNGGKTYDAYSREAQDIYWNYLYRGLYSLGVDAWWVDATEPDWKWCDSLLEEKEGIVRNGHTALGTSSRYLNTYALMATGGIYRNQRRANPNRRVVMLTRSAFVGQQRNAAAVWSGDISSTWPTFRNQIADGINFCMAGIPYWNSDIGGFLPKEYGGEYPMGTQDPAFRELYVRWFEFGAFCPVFRSHGTDFPREVWRFGEPGSWAYDALLKYLNLRYRLLPYIYSTAWKVTHEGYTMMRGLPMDFGDDPAALNNGDEFMFGPALLVAPVTRSMYFPKLPGVVIPQTNLSTPDGKPGLLGHYFRGMKFDSLACVRRDTTINFHWADSGAPGVGRSHFSVRWKGHIRAPESGTYQFETISDDGVNLFIGGQQLMDEMYPGGKQTNYAEATLHADSLYEIVLEYYQENGGAEVTLTWRTPSMLSARVPRTEIQSWPVYLPGKTLWYDFWTGDSVRGGSTVMKPAPVDLMPLYVRGGSIIPLGPLLQYADEKKADTVELRIYRGRDGQFILYEDEGDGYAYERGVYATIPIRWKDATGILEIGERKGSFPGMLRERIFRVIVVRPGVGTGLGETVRANRTVRYSGKKIVMRLAGRGLSPPY